MGVNNSKKGNSPTKQTVHNDDGFVIVTHSTMQHENFQGENVSRNPIETTQNDHVIENSDQICNLNSGGKGITHNGHIDCSSICPDTCTLKKKGARRDSYGYDVIRSLGDVGIGKMTDNIMTTNKSSENGIQWVMRLNSRTTSSYISQGKNVKKTKGGGEHQVEDTTIKRTDNGTMKIFTQNDKKVKEKDNKSKKTDKKRKKEKQKKEKKSDPNDLRKDEVTDKNNNTVWSRAIFQEPFLPNYPINHEKIKTYDVIRLIGIGSFSHVYHVISKETGEHLALKRIRKTDIIKQRICCQLQEEIDILSALKSHQFIIGIVGCWQTKGYLLQLLPYATNGDLHTLWERVKKFPMLTVASVTAEVANGLAFIQKHKIIYRDLKMDNILISHSGHILLSDFGLSKIMGTLSRTYTVCGTLDYVAPEVLLGSGYSYQCDWWSLGVVIVAMATGALPFKTAKNPILMNDVIRREVVELPKSINNPMVKEVILKLLSPQYTNRVCTLAKLQQLQLFSILNIGELQSTNEGPLKRYFGEFNSLAIC